MEENNFVGPRDYKKLDIEGAVVVRSKRFGSGIDEWMYEPVDFTELTYFLGYHFDPRGMHMFKTGKGVIRGGHLEGRSKCLTVVSGCAFIVLVDMRSGKNQGKVQTVYLGDDDRAWGNTLFSSEGILIASISMTDDCISMVVADRPYNRFDSLLTLDITDPELGIEFPEGVIFPESKDKKTVSYKEFIERI
ncbi:MAG: dTDP-4-dehydrorhamnose 3,5-epimerase family protein [Microgenomates group bacterium]